MASVQVPEVEIPPIITETINAQYIGSFIPLFFFGILSNQVYMYFQAFPNDRLGIKMLVFTIYGIVVTQIAMFIHDGFEIYGPGFGNIAGAFKVRNTWLSGLILDGTVACFVQVFYAWRISIISGKKFPSILIMLTSLISVVPSFVSGIRLIVHHEVEGYSEGRLTTLLWLGSAVACDIQIAAFMTFYLKRHCPAGPQFQSTVNKVNRIVRLTIQSGTLTAGFAIITFIILTIPRTAFYSAAILSSLSGIYSTTFMSLLNSRISISINAPGESHENGDTSAGLSTSSNRVYGARVGSAPGMKFAAPSDSVLVNVIKSDISMGTLP